MLRNYITMQGTKIIKEYSVAFTAHWNTDAQNSQINMVDNESDRLCGLVVRVSGYRYRGPGFDPRRYQIF